MSAPDDIGMDGKPGTHAENQILAIKSEIENQKSLISRFEQFIEEKRAKVIAHFENPEYRLNQEISLLREKNKKLAMYDANVSQALWNHGNRKYRDEIAAANMEGYGPRVLSMGTWSDELEENERITPQTQSTIEAMKNQTSIEELEKMKKWNIESELEKIAFPLLDEDHPLTRARLRLGRLRERLHYYESFQTKPTKTTNLTKAEDEDEDEEKDDDEDDLYYSGFQRPPRFPQKK